MDQCSRETYLKSLSVIPDISSINLEPRDTQPNSGKCGFKYEVGYHLFEIESSCQRLYNLVDKCKDVNNTMINVIDSEKQAP